MPDVEECLSCGVLDALARHDPMCDRAIKLGLPRLAEGEEPIDPGEEEEAGLEREFTEVEEPVETETWSEQPEAMLRAVATDNVVKRFPPPEIELWFSYRSDADGGFDVIVFEGELDALRYAVSHGQRVQELKLGESLREQVNDGD